MSPAKASRSNPATTLEEKKPMAHTTSEQSATYTFDWGTIKTYWFGFVMHLDATAAAQFNSYTTKFANGLLKVFGGAMPILTKKTLEMAIKARSALIKSICEMSEDRGCQLVSLWPTPLMLLPLPEPPFVGTVYNRDRAKMKYLVYATADGWGDYSWFTGDSVADSRPAIAEFNGKLVMVYRGHNENDRDELSWALYDPNPSYPERNPGWSAPLQLKDTNGSTIRSARGVGLAEFANKLYMIHRGKRGDQKLYFNMMDSTYQWTGDSPISNGSPLSQGSPAVAVWAPDGVNPKLFVAVQSGHGSNILGWTYLDEQGSWYPFRDDTALTTTTGPALAVYNSELHLVRRGSDSNDAQLSHAVFDFRNRSWSPRPSMGNKYTNAEPSLATYDGKLYCAARGADQDEGTPDELWWTYYDGSSWSKYKTTATAAVSAAGPALISYKDLYAPTPNPEAEDPTQQFPYVLLLIHQGGNALLS
ncbi:hypothetical protein QWJ26_39575 [Streptomyces sp. CSDS2]|uniref:hypothetical protein n=1 Tax=Streptomyces sp. CSDS2 TaxID=3055051 RepID=UPI0025AF9C2F|nr:hypothetical protein [Streptomyces sp. CSDS2]MDN3265793.1 hypothetical protein [Streptomyces sp. CSDS2]